MIRAQRIKPLVAIVLGAVLALSLADARAVDGHDDTVRPEQLQSGSLLLRMRSGYRVATLLNTDVDMSISGLVARVTVRQSFENTGAEWAEGIYVFPLPDKAAVDHMRLQIGERFIEGEIREKAEAKKQYEQAKAEGRKASLVEQERPNLFTTSVANIAPGETVVVEIEYLEDLVYDNGRFSLRFPMTLTPRYMPGDPLPDRQGNGWSADTTEVADASRISPPMVTRSAGHRATIDVDLDAGMSLATVTSRYHPVNVVESGGRYAITLASPTVPLDHDFELVWKPAAGSEPRAMLFSEHVNGDAHYLLLVMPPSVADASLSALPREMIFIIDTSGSMHGTSIVQARLALARALEKLNPGDRFNVIAFSSRPNPLFPASVAADRGNLEAARRFVASLAASGGTEMRSALELAFRQAPSETHLRQIVFITDGAVGNEAALFELIERRLGSGRLFTVGIGSAPNGWFMRKASETGRGSFTMIGAQAEVGEKMAGLFAKIEQPQVTDIVVTWPGNVIVDAYPATVPDLYASEPVWIKAKVTGP
ncbi:MAG: marine proteobacterial sortase target protein, partial [Woeseiaceae bacterium]|nr:marine proteobacterial sortase target protein [Woeseiaceae bacterium]